MLFASLILSTRTSFVRSGTGFTGSRLILMAMASSTSSSESSGLNSLVSPSDILGKTSDIKFIDGSWHMNKSRDGASEFQAERISGAKFFDIDAISDKSSSLPHMLPSNAEFSEAITKLGISNDDQIVVYTTAGCFSASRVWWTLKAFGHKKVSILNGGLENWKKHGGAIDTTPPRDPESHPSKPYEANLNEHLVVDKSQVLKVVETGSAQICDARSTARFLAQAPEPRPGLEGGHIPGSLNLPFTALVTDDPTTFRSKEEIRDALLASGVVFGSKIILSCGSGVTACVIAFCLDLMGKPLIDAPVYDGSWSEWGNKTNGLPISKEQH